VPGEGRAWLLVLAAIFAWQGWLTLTLFGSWEALLDEQPLLSGRHPLHLYHGRLGADSLARRGSPSCYDPAFEAGYLKSPVFDSGSRPVEAFLLLAGQGDKAAACKLGLAGLCLLVPVLLAAAARAAGLTRRAVAVSALLGVLAWWGKPGVHLLRAGSLDVSLAALTLLTQVGLWSWYHRQPGLPGWFALLLTGLVGWFAHPVVFALTVPLLLVLGLSVGPRHSLGWNVSLWAALGLGLLGNYLVWLRDGIRFLWLRAGWQTLGYTLQPRTPAGLWQAELWGETVDRVLAGVVVLSALVGAYLLNRRGERAVARLFGLGSGCLAALAVGGLLWTSLARHATTDLFVPGLLLAVPLAGFGLEQALEGLKWALGSTARASLGLAVLAGGITVACWEQWPELAGRWIQAQELPLGLGERRAVIATLESHTNCSARILWEDRLPPASRWTCLLPMLTDRSFLGGLDPEGEIEHSAIVLANGRLAGRPIAEWSDEELEDYCRRYNVGWVVCWTEASRQRWGRWKRCQPLLALRDGQEGTLFRIDRPHSFILKGTAAWVRADSRMIALADVEPEDGEVVLSLHFQEGFVASPNRVSVERHLDSRDPIPFIRLRMDAPVAHLTLTWQR
jgi:hypothetical protein